MNFLWPGAGKIDTFGTITSPGHMATPLNIVMGGVWATDLGCLIGPKYVKKINLSIAIPWLDEMKIYKNNCLWVAGADVVEDAKSTLEAYHEVCLKYFEGWPICYIAQNGAEDLEIPESAAAVFIGGDTTWKCSMAAVSVIKRAQNMGKMIHIGRINWWKRYKIFKILEGSENFTCDGTRPKFDGRENSRKAWKHYENTKPLFTI